MSTFTRYEVRERREYWEERSFVPETKEMEDVVNTRISGNGML